MNVSISVAAAPEKTFAQLFCLSVTANTRASLSFHILFFFTFLFFLISHLPLQGVLHFVLTHDSSLHSAVLLEIKVSPLANRFRLSRGSASRDGGVAMLHSCSERAIGNLPARGRDLKLGQGAVPLPHLAAKKF